MATLIPIEGNPFSVTPIEQKKKDGGTVKLTPVEYNPFNVSGRETVQPDSTIPDPHANFAMPESSFAEDAVGFTKMVGQKGVDYAVNEGPDLAKEGAKSFARGWNVLVPQQAGKAMQFLKRFSDEMLTPEGFKNPIEDYARGLLQGAGESVEGFGDAQQKRLDPIIGMSEKGRNAPWYSPMHMMATGPENAVQSAIPLAAGLVTGGVPGIVAGAATLGALFYGGTAEDKYREAIKHGLDKESAFKLANIEGGIEAGGEAIQDLIPLRLFGIASKPVKDGIVKSVASKLGFKEALKNIGKTIFGEVATESGQAATQTYFSNEMGVPVGSIKKNVLDVIGPTIFMSLVFGGFGTAYNAQARKKIVDTLSNPKSSNEEFNAAVNMVAGSVSKVDKGLAKDFKDYAVKARNNNQPVIIGDDSTIKNGEAPTKQIDPKQEQLEVARLRDRIAKDPNNTQAHLKDFLASEFVRPEIKDQVTKAFGQERGDAASAPQPPPTPSEAAPTTTLSDEDVYWQKEESKILDQRKAKEEKDKINRVRLLRSKINSLKNNPRKNKEEIERLSGILENMGPVDQFKVNQAEIEATPIEEKKYQTPPQKNDNLSIALNWMLNDAKNTEAPGNTMMSAMDAEAVGQEEVTGFKASSSEWYQKLNKMAAQRGMKLLGRADIETLVTKHMNDEKFTPRQQRQFDLLKEVADKEVWGKNPEFLAMAEMQNLSRRGWDVMGGQEVPVGDLKAGDRFVGFVPGRSEIDEYKVTELKENGDVVLQDGTKETLDVFDQVSVLGMKRAPDTIAETSKEKRTVSPETGKTLTSNLNDVKIEPAKNVPSILDRFEAEQQERLNKRKSGDRRVSIVNLHPVTEMIEGKYASKRLAEIGAETSSKHNVPVTYVEGDLYNLGGLNAKFGQTGADPHFKALADIAREEFEKLGSEIGFTTKGGDEFGFTVVGATKEQVDDVLDRIKPRAEQYIKDNNLESVPHTKNNRNPGTGLIFASKQFDFDKYNRAAEQHRKEEGIKDEDSFTAVDAWIKDADLEVEALKYEGGFGDEFRKQTEEVGDVPPKGQPGGVGEEVAVDAGGTGNAGEIAEGQTARQAHLASLKPAQQETAQAYYDYVDSLTDEQRNAVSKIITDTPTSPQMDLAKVKAAVKKHDNIAKLKPKKADVPSAQTVTEPSTEAVPAPKAPVETKAETPVEDPTKLAKSDKRGDNDKPKKLGDISKAESEFFDYATDRVLEATEAVKRQRRKELSKNGRVVVEDDMGLKDVLTKNMSGGEHKWRITTFQPDGTPSGHTVHKTISDALDEIKSAQSTREGLRSDIPEDYLGSDPGDYEHIYKSTLRPVGPGAVPRDGLIRTEGDVNAEWGQFGNAVYSRVLTADELDHFSLDPVGYNKVDKGKPSFMLTDTDARYLELAKDPEANREELQKMVDEAAKRAGYDVGPVYHGSEDADIKIFEPGREEPGVWLTKNFQGAGSYMGIDGKVYAAYLRPGRTMTVTFTDDMEPMVNGKMSDIGENVQFAEAAEREGYDAVFFPEGNFSEDKETWAVFSSENIKSADPVTYYTKDDPAVKQGKAKAGDVIPLSERFDEASDDIRFKLDDNKSLYIAHNLSEDNLRHALELGGLAMPSMAIADINKGAFTGFGDISLIADPEILKSGKVKAFDADIYSPRHPRPTYEINNDAVNALNEWIKKDNPLVGRERPWADLLDADEIKTRGMDELINNTALKYAWLKENGKEPKRGDIWSAVRKRLRTKKAEQEFAAFVREKFKDIVSGKKLFKGYTYGGSKRYAPYTLENVVKAMKAEKLKGGENFFYGAGSVRASQAKEYKSLAAIKKDKDRLVKSGEEINKIKDDFQNKLSDLLESLKPYYRFSADSFGYYDDAAQAIVEGQRGLNEAFEGLPQEEVSNIKDFLSELSSAPTEYFEVKASRSVGLDEFHTAVVPRGTSKDVADALKDNGVNVKYYKQGDEADRQAKIRQVDDVLFKRQSTGKGITKEQAEEDQRSFDDLTKNLKPIEKKQLLHLIKTKQGVDNPNALDIINFIEDYATDETLHTEVIDSLIKKIGGPSDAVHYSRRPGNKRGLGKLEQRKILENLESHGYKTDGVKFRKAFTKEEKAVEKICKALGLTVHYYQDKTGFFKNVSGVTTNIAPNSILINAKTKHHLLQVAGHEFVHTLRRTHEDLYSFLVDSLKNDIVDFSGWVDRLDSLGYQNITTEKAVEELMGDFVGDQITKPEFWQKLNEENPSLTKRLANAVHKILEKIKRAVYRHTDRSSNHIANIEEAQKVVARVVGEVGRRIEQDGPASKETPQFMVSYHGTPHVFAPEPGFPHGRFRLDKVFNRETVGEGAWAYGAGVYIAEEKELGRKYKENLEESPYLKNWKFGSANLVKDSEYIDYSPYENSDRAQAKAVLSEDLLIEERNIVEAFNSGGIETARSAMLSIADDRIEMAKEEWPEVVPHLKVLRNAIEKRLKFDIAQEEGSLYTLDLPDSVIPKLLDWDNRVGDGYVEKIISDTKSIPIEETRTYKELVRVHGEEKASEYKGTIEKRYKKLIEKLKEFSKDEHLRGHELYKGISNILGSDIEASEFLARAGIPGNVHGGVSKGATGKKYVIWDQAVLDQIALLERNGEKLDDIAENDPAFMFAGQKGSRMDVGTAASVDPNFMLDDEGVSDAQRVLEALAGYDKSGKTRKAIKKLNTFDGKHKEKAKLLGRLLSDEKTAKLREKKMAATYALIDSNDPLKQIQGYFNIQDENLDAYQLERLRGKREAGLIKEFRRERLQPIIDRMAKAGINLDQMDEYRHAKHAPEANKRLELIRAKDTLTDYVDRFGDKELEKQLQTIKADVKTSKKQHKDFQIFNSDLGAWEPTEIHERYVSLLNSIKPETKEQQDFIDNWNNTKVRLAGITNEEAAEILAKYKGNQEIESLRKEFAKIDDEKLQMLFDSGEITADQLNAIRETYKYYAPLYREGMDGGMTSGRKLGPLGKPIKVRAGSTKKVSDISAHTISNYETALSRSLKSETGQMLYNLVEKTQTPKSERTDPDKAVWWVEESPKQPGYDAEGNITYYPDMAEPSDGFYVKINGERKLIRVNAKDPTMKRFLESVKQAPEQNGVVRVLSSVNRFLAAVNTSLSPEFILSNLSRDLQTAAIHIEDTEIKGMQKKVLKQLPKAIKGIWKAEQKNAKDGMSSWYRDFEKNGGKIGWMSGYEEIKDISKRLQAELNEASGKAKTMASAKKLMKLIENANTAIENGVRLATYKTMVEKGYSKKKAASVASNLTVDFTKKGKYGGTINAFYLFANASIQGNVRIVEAAVKSPKVRKIIGGIVASGFAMNMLGLMMGGDDDDGIPYYDKLRETNSDLFERNIVIMTGNKGQHIKIPMPWGYNAFYNLGHEISNAVYKTASGDTYDPRKGAARVASGFVNSFNPLASATILQTLAPTVLDPIAVVSENVNWHGGPLMPEENPFSTIPKPDSQRFFRSVSKPSKFIAQTLNSLTGGDTIKPGLVDVSPETLDLMYDTVTGSMGRFVRNTALIPFAEEPSQIPFVRRFYGEKSKYVDNQIYYDTVQDVLMVKEQIEAGSETLKNPMARYIPLATQAEKELRRLRKIKKKAEANGANTDLIEKRIDAVQKNFLRTVTQERRKAN